MKNLHQHNSVFNNLLIENSHLGQIYMFNDQILWSTGLFDCHQDERNCKSPCLSINKIMSFLFFLVAIVTTLQHFFLV